MKIGKIIAVCVSNIRGIQKKNVRKCHILKDYGLVGDAHALKGSNRQVSILSKESIEKFEKEHRINVEYGAFGENLVIEGITFKDISIGQRIRIGDVVLLEITQIGKKCHVGCVISKKTGKCIMPLEGIFGRVLNGGQVKIGDKVEIIS